MHIKGFSGDSIYLWLKLDGDTLDSSGTAVDDGDEVGPHIDGGEDSSGNVEQDPNWRQTTLLLRYLLHLMSCWKSVGRDTPIT